MGGHNPSCGAVIGRPFFQDRPRPSLFVAIIREDFYPKRPTRESLRAALPAFLTAAFLAVAPWAWDAEVGMAIVTLEMPLLFLLVIAGASSASGSRLVRWFGLTWALVLFTAITASVAIGLRDWTILFAAGGVVFAHGATFVRRDRWLHRDMLMARSGLALAAMWILIFVAGFASVALFGQDAPEAAFVSFVGAPLFVLHGLADLHRILVVPPANAGPDWWRWNPSAPAS